METNYTKSILENKLNLANETLDKVIGERNMLRDALAGIVNAANPKYVKPELLVNLDDAIEYGKDVLIKTI